MTGKSSAYFISLVSVDQLVSSPAQPCSKYSTGYFFAPLKYPAGTHTRYFMTRSSDSLLNVRLCRRDFVDVDCAVWVAAADCASKPLLPLTLRASSTISRINRLLFRTVRASPAFSHARSRKH